MNKILPLLLLFFAFNSKVFAFNIVYPAHSNVTINSPSTFFIGSAKSKLSINGEHVKIHHSGGFAHVVKLNEGENRFIIKSKNDEKTFVINRPKIKPFVSNNLPGLIEYSSKKEFITSSDNVPLRSTPINSGVNRIAHYPKNIPLTIDGEKNEFYRVFLCPEKNAWVSKSDVKSFTSYQPASLNGYDFVDDDEFYTFIFHLNKKVPFEITEGEIFNLKFYNVKDNPQNIYSFDFPYYEKSGVKKLFGYNGQYIGNDFVFKVRKPPVIDKKHPLKNITITIDAGHGGKEFGAIGCLGNKEKDINLNIAKYLEKELKKHGANVLMTRTDDSYISLNDRITIANKNNSMFLLSIHANSLPDSANPNEHQGTSVYYYYNQAKLLAANILVSINTNAGTKNDKIRQASLALVRNTDALSILIEIAYLINPADNSMITNEHFQKRCAIAITDAIQKFLTE